MIQLKSIYLVLLLICVSIGQVPAKKTNQSELLNSDVLKGLKFRSIGPAFMSGRIADIAIHPNDESIWYVAVGSGGVWKTTNSGTTWKPIFDNQNSYSIGCVALNPNNPHEVWVGTGENVGGRHVGFGDGLYVSPDAGKTWKHVGLKASEHISKIIFHPTKANVIWVAVQGPLWSKGGDRGLYKTFDGGETWNKILGDDEYVGVTDIILDPRNPDRLYAATWERYRTVAAYVGGGKGSAIYVTNDGGTTWDKLEKGLPKGPMGKIGLAISPQNPDIVYAAIELNRRTGGVYKSVDKGASWEKQSDAVAGATGPHYYQELYASPHKFDLIYLVDNEMQISEDGGKTFKRMNEKNKHVDNHAIAFKTSDEDYLLVGTDGGLYQTYDHTKTWDYIANLPVTQFYKVAVDDAEPFYNIYGGTQDNNSQGGPSRTDNVHGIRNSDWFITLFADGHQSATEPGNPDIVYAEFQEGNLYRNDRTNGELVYIQPQPRAGEHYERYNWDAPILVSPHKATRLYFASQRVWKSEDRGDSWIPVSGDLTKNQERMNLPLGGKTHGWDSPWDLLAMSNYNTITSLAESPLKEGLLYAGTDDGLIQVSADGGKNWRKIPVSELPGCPATAFVNDIKADLFNDNTVYVALDNHKYGDFAPYLYKSADAGNSWELITTGLPERTLVWRMVQDHVKPELMFAGTEFGVYVTFNGGQKWIALKGGMPTIAVRDLAIQQRENDLVAATFGRGFYVLDNYSLLRSVSEETLQKEAILYTSRDAEWYIPRFVISTGGKGSQGDSYFTAPNPPFGANFTVYLKNGFMSKEKERQKNETNKLEKGEEVRFPGWDSVESERREDEITLWLEVNNGKEVVRRVKCPVSKGLHRVNWDLRFSGKQPILHSRLGKINDLASPKRGGLAEPGTYMAQLVLQKDGEKTKLGEAVSFNVQQINKGSLGGKTPTEMVAFVQKLEHLRGDVSVLNHQLSEAFKRVNALQDALAYARKGNTNDLAFQIKQFKNELYDIEEQLTGNKLKDAIGEKVHPTISSRLSHATMGTSYSTYGPTPSHEQSLQIAQDEYELLNEKLELIMNEKLPELYSKIEELGVPWVEGQQ